MKISVYKFCHHDLPCEEKYFEGKRGRKMVQKNENIRE